jgi:hypothetical protein
MSRDGNGYTLESIGEELSLHVQREKEMYVKLESLYQTVVVGNGKPSLKHEVSRHSDWINSFNKFVWIVIGALVANFVASSFAFLVMVLIMLVNSGVLKP